MRTARKKQRHIADAQLAAMVIAMRLPVMAMESLTDKTRGPETSRAVSEKVAAAVDGAVSAQLSVMNSAATFWLDVMSGKSPASLINAAVNKATDAALKPGRKTLRANYKRLVPGA
ncbi:hypothetical protein [Phyllobacterium lublinensis]|uniref:hypothetical protein n=1 Tax=Phyllobacterium lublinensis TaxID=2875708 RepID=UPI001CCE22DC|nr:hypothetical protein [Phyllobacterium sp. 2063]MBZ9653242.1 hypothetical protein [Phyllobacterium sp. 2063]